MREDGAELDKFLLTRDEAFRPHGYELQNPVSVSPEGSVPASFEIQRGKDGDGSAEVTGERQQWHRITVDFNGPWAHEQADPNPFVDYEYRVVFEPWCLAKRSEAFLVYVPADFDGASLRVGETGVRYDIRIWNPGSGKEVRENPGQLSTGEMLALPDGEVPSAERVLSIVRVEE